MSPGAGFRGGTLQTRVGRRVFVLFIVCAALPVTVLGIASYLSIAASLREQAFDRSRLTAKRTGLALFERLEDLESSLRLLAPGFADGPSGLREQADERFAGMTLISGGVVRHHVGTLAAMPALSPRQQDHLRSGGTIIAVSGDSSRAILMAQNVATAGNSSGVIWAQVSEESVDRVLAAESPTVPAESCIVQLDGGLIRCSGRDAPLRNAVFARGSRSEHSGAFVWESDQRYLAGFWSLFLDAHFGSPDWRIIASEPESEILAPLASFRRSFVLAGVLALFIVGVLSTGQIRRSLGPLTALREGTERIARLKFDQPVEVKSGDEFEDLAGAFNAMSEGLRNQFVEAARLNQALASTSEELRERQVRLTAILDTAADAIMTVDTDGHVESFNRTAEKVFALREAEAVGRPLNDLFAGPLGTGLGSLPTGRSEAAGAGLEVTGRRRDGASFPAEVTFTEARAGDRTIYTIFVRDISDRKRAAEQREQLEAQLRHAEKLETIGTLAGGIAHDFNNLLTPILGYVELLTAEADSESTKADLEQVRHAAHRAKDLVKQILLFSRRGVKKYSVVDVSSVVMEALKLVRSSLPATIEIQSSIAEDVELVLADPTQLHQVVMNLCTNAYQAMRTRGGVLEVRLEMMELNTQAARALPEFGAVQAVRLMVRDTGLGMDAATLERLFEPFFTTKPVGEGTGLGMSIVHGIIAEHGGTITVESTPGIGTTFEVYLPPSPPDEGVEEIAAVAPQARGEGRILVVDDDAAIARLVARSLERQGYEAVHTTAPAEVLRMLTTAEPPFDLVITDHTMPGMTGLQLAEQIKCWHPGFPVMLLSGLNEIGETLDPADLGLRGFLMKPVELKVLVTAVGRVLAEDRPAPVTAGSAQASKHNG